MVGKRASVKKEVYDPVGEPNLYLVLTPFCDLPTWPLGLTSRVRTYSLGPVYLCEFVACLPAVRGVPVQHFFCVATSAGPVPSLLSRVQSISLIANGGESGDQAF